jgi:bifunctional UDP-N-acetylglucosamine pyrophosphorylase / glucosamine-1-phosphate N-acetyltransferase
MSPFVRCPLGNADVGAGVNIGATAVTANFDGELKHPTKIGDQSRIGAGAILVAPVSIGQEAVIGANAVVTRNQDVADGQTVVGVPARPLKPSRRQD